jgi:outer membrane protein assembly factor BamB
LVASGEDGTVSALSLNDGKTLWTRDLEHPLIAGPAFFMDQVIQGTATGTVTALEPEDGSPLWSVDLLSPIRLPQTPFNDQLFVPLASGHLISLDATGTQRWQVTLSANPSTPAKVCGNFVLVGTEAGTVEAYDYDSGRRLWVYDAPAPVSSPFLCHRKRIYFGTADYRMNAIKRKGKHKWSYPVGGNVTSSPLGVDRRVYFLSFDNNMYALKARSGHLLFRVRMGFRLSQDALRTDDRIYLSPYTSGRLETLLLPNLERLAEYRLDLEGEWFTTPPVKVGDRVFVGYGRYEGRILALREEISEEIAGDS